MEIEIFANESLLTVPREQTLRTTPRIQPGECHVTTRAPRNLQNKLPKLDLSPVVYVTATQIQQSLPTRALTVLLDSGSSHTMMKRTSLPHGAIPTPSHSRKTTTTNGTFATNSMVTLTDVKFPEFGNHSIPKIEAAIFDSPTCRYDIILGRDILKLMGAHINFSTHTVSWMGREIQMKPIHQINTDIPRNQIDNYFLHLQEEEDEDFDILAELYADDIVIMDRKYLSLIHI